MINLVEMLKLQELEGGTYTIDTLLRVIKDLTNNAMVIGVALVGLAFVICFILYAIGDSDQKHRLKVRLIQTGVGFIGLAFSVSIVNYLIKLIG